MPPLSSTTDHNSPIFIHAFWRTGSTYVWKKFHETSEYRAYYEPLHEKLLTARRPADSASQASIAMKAKLLRHPEVSGSYFRGFPFHDGGGVEYFEQEFPYRRYCLEPGAEDPMLYRYLANLISSARAGGQIPVFKFTRSLLRSRWLAERFPSRNLLLLRRPADIWRSFVSAGTNYYAAALCCLIGQNSDSPLLRRLFQIYKIPEYRGPSVSSDLAFYASVARARLDSLYPMFFEFYILTCLCNLALADSVIDMNEISGSQRVRESVRERLCELGIDMAFDDVKTLSYGDNPPAWLEYEEAGCRRLLLEVPHDLLIRSDAIERHTPAIGAYFAQVFKPFML